MNRALAYRPVDQDFLIAPTGVLLASLAGIDGFVNVGDVESATSTFESESEDIYTHQTAVRSKVGKRVMSSTLSGSFTLQQLTPEFWAVSHMSDPTLTFEQEAVAGGSLEVAKSKPGRIFDTGAKKISAVTVKSKDIVDADVNLVLGTHFQIDDVVGNVEIISFPAEVAIAADGTAPITIGFTAPAIAGVPALGPGSKLEVRGALKYRGMNTKGIQELVELHDVAFTVSAEKTWVANSADLGTIQIDWEAFIDPTQPVEFGYGHVIDLKALAAA